MPCADNESIYKPPVTQRMQWRRLFESGGIIGMGVARPEGPKAGVGFLGREQPAPERGGLSIPDLKLGRSIPHSPGYDATERRTEP